MVKHKRSTGGRSGQKDNQTKPFAFSVNELTSLDELLWSINQLHHRVDKFGIIELPALPLSSAQEFEQSLGDGLDSLTLHEELDDWGRQVWGLLNAENGPMGRAFFLGGSLANTYWYTTMVWSDDNIVAEFLNPFRLSYLAAQFEIIAEVLPPYFSNILGYSLHKWSDVRLNLVNKDKLKSRLEAQQEVWRDLLFGRRSAESYLRAKHYRIINSSSRGVQIGVALILVAFVAATGWGIGSIIEKTQTLSADIAAVSSFLVGVGALVVQFTSWIRRSGDSVGESVKLRLILSATYRDWHPKQ